MNKPLTATTIILLCFSLIATAQSNTEYFKKIKSFTVQPSTDEEITNKLPFSKIEVKDFRFDTTKAGYVRTGYKYKKLVTKNNISSSFEALLNKQFASHFDKGSKYHLLLVIKHLWLQETSDAEESNAKIAMQSDFLKNYSLGKATIEVYAKDQESYIPLFKLDTTITKDKKLSKIADELMIAPFVYCLQKLCSKNIDKAIATRRKIEEAEFLAYQNRRQNLLTAQHTITKGIYMTFKDFLNNTPITQAFEVKTGLTDDLYLLENGGQRVVEKFWGYSDGERLFIRIDYSFFELCKDGKTYSLWGSKGIVHHYNPLWISSNPNGNARTSKMDRTMRPMQLNMETGKVY